MIIFLVLYTSLYCEDDCILLLGYSISIILAIITLLYSLYIVQDFFDRLLHHQVKPIYLHRLVIQ